MVEEVAANVDVNDDLVESTTLTDDEQAELTEAEAQVEQVSYSGTDFDVEGLVRRLGRGDIIIPTFGHGDSSYETAGFQRSFVWRKSQMDRFIESLLLSFPIPGIMLVQQVDRRYLVLDGQQRLRTLAAFYRGVHKQREFSLENVAAQFKGLTYETLDAPTRRQLDNTFIQATILKTDGSNESLESIYQVFERLNSGGTQLTPHEIRIALYPGKLVDLLEELNGNKDWRVLYGAKSPRVRDQELILRIIALFVSPNDYSRPQKKFLNEFLGNHRNLQGLDVPTIKKLFAASAATLLEGAGRGALRFQSNQVNAALAEALFVGMMQRSQRSARIAPAKVKKAVESVAKSSVMVDAISGSTAREDSVKARLSFATEAFKKV